MSKKNSDCLQSSWTKCAVDVDSPQSMSPSDELSDPPDSTCAQVIHPKPETFCDDWVPMTADRECKGQKEFAGITTLSQLRIQDSSIMINL